MIWYVDGGDAAAVATGHRLTSELSQCWRDSSSMDPSLWKPKIMKRFSDLRYEGKTHYSYIEIL
jgi:tRNA U34 5-methylaminomethyl-2-thiouridine-forming methyltransferase MnmC